MTFCKKHLANVVWELTLKCNAKCLHCGSTACIDRKNSLTYDEAVSVVHQLSDMKCDLLTLIGGEYFLYPKWRELLDEISAVKMKFAIVTNGLMLSDEYLDILMAHRIYGIGVSIDAPNAKIHDYIRQVPGCFNRAFDAVKRARSRRIPTTVITTINRLNISSLKEMRTLLAQNKMRGWQLQHTNIFGRMKQAFSLDDFGFYVVGIFCAQTGRLYDKKDLEILAMHCMGYYSKTIPCHVPNRFWTGCFAGRSIMGIRSDGNVMGCLSIYDDRFIEGNVRDKPLSEIRTNKCFCQWNHRLTKYKNLTGFCRDCPYGLICLGGCTSFSENQHHCYYEIEQKMTAKSDRTDVEEVLYQLTTGHMDKSGRFYLKSGQEITADWIKSLTIPDEYKQQLAILVVD